jgi:hypothetical protein
MKEFLKRLKLVSHFTLEIETEKSVFVGKLKANVDEGNTSVLFSIWEKFGSSKNEYKGTVEDGSFKIRRRRKLFDMNMNLAVVSGSYRQRDHILFIEAEVNGFHGVFIPFYIFLPIFYLVAIAAFLLSENASQMWFVLPFMLLHAVFMMGIPYFVMRRSVNRMKYEVERDFYFLAKK